MNHSVRALAAVAATIAVAFPAAASAANFSESFDTVVPGGWATTNLSSPLGANSWFQGTPVSSTGPFDAHQGAPNAYAAANFASTGSTGTISNWLISPEQGTLTNGDAWSFFTRKAAPDLYADRLEVRLSTNSQCNPGVNPTSVGDFTTLLTTINPTLQLGVYPTAWTQISGVLAGLPANASGCFAFRYFVTNAGSGGSNSDYIGVDTFSFTEDVVAPGPPTVSSVTPSPANDNTPEVTGSGAEAGSTVGIFNNASCAGPAIGSGPAASFNGGAGVTANVADNTTTTLYAAATDESSNTSSCSGTSVVYVEDSAPPATPSVDATSPASPANDNNPEVTGSGAEAGSTVRIYDNASCAGAPLGTGPAADFNGGSGITVSVADDAVTSLHASATDGATNTSACSGPHGYTEDSSSPTPTITATTAASPANDNNPEVTGSGAEAGSTVRIYDNASCAGAPLGTGPAADFNGGAGITVTVADDSVTNLSAQATDSLANVSGCSAGYPYTEVSTLPPPPGGSPGNDQPPSITSLKVSPKRFAAGTATTPLARKTGAKIKLTLSEAATVSFQVKPAKGRRPSPFSRELAAGASAVDFTGKLGKRALKPGRYKLTAVATDSAGQDSSPATAKFRIKK